MHFPATSTLFPQHTPTAPYPSAWTPMTQKMKRMRRRTRRTWSQRNVSAASNTSGRATNSRCTASLRTSCLCMAWSRPQRPARGIWTGQSQGPWLTAGAQRLRTTSRQAGPVLSAPPRDPSLQMETSTRQWPLRGILLACVCADTRRSQVRKLAFYAEAAPVT